MNLGAELPAVEGIGGTRRDGGAPRRQRQVDLPEFKASHVYKPSSRTARAGQRNPASETKKVWERLGDRKLP